MRTDAILINVNRSEKHTQMDRAGEGNKKSSQGFAMHGDQPQKASFNEVYNSVAKSNNMAREKTENSVQTFKKSNKSAENTDDLKKALSVLDSSTEEELQKKTDESGTATNDLIMQQLQQFQQIQDIANIQQWAAASQAFQNSGAFTAEATEVIIASVQKIADTLQIDIVSGFDKMTFDSVSNETVSKFAEIISTLKSIIDALDFSVQENETLDTGRTVLDVQSAVEVSKGLKSEMFKLQLGLNMIGIGEKIQLEASSQLGLPVYSGIPQASDPLSLSMPVEQIKQIFGDLIEEVSQGKESATPQITLTDFSDVSTADALPVKFDSQTYRALLKIEKKEAVSLENSDAAKGVEKLEFADVAEPVVASDVSQQSQETDLLPLIEPGKSSYNPETVSLESRISRALTRTTDENVMNQLTGKFGSLIRSGETEVRLQLRPEALGEVNLAIRMDGEVVTARIQVENQQVKQIVESNLQSLKDALAEQNLQAGSFEVNVGDGWGRHSNQRDQVWEQRAHSTAGSNNENDLNEKDNKSQNTIGVETGNRYGNNSFEYYA